MRDVRNKVKSNSRTLQPTKVTKRDFLAHVYQYVHYVEDVLCTRTHWPESTVRQKGIQLKQMMQDMEE